MLATELAQYHACNVFLTLVGAVNAGASHFMIQFF